MTIDNPRQVRERCDALAHRLQTRPPVGRDLVFGLDVLRALSGHPWEILSYRGAAESVIGRLDAPGQANPERPLPDPANDLGEAAELVAAYLPDARAGIVQLDDASFEVALRLVGLPLRASAAAPGAARALLLAALRLRSLTAEAEDAGVAVPTPTIELVGPDGNPAPGGALRLRVGFDPEGPVPPADAFPIDLTLVCHGATVEGGEVARAVSRAGADGRPEPAAFEARVAPAFRGTVRVIALTRTADGREGSAKLLVEAAGA